VISGAYATGTGVARNPAEALRWAQAAAQTGDAFGHYVLAINYLNGTGVQADLNQARRHLMIASDRGRAHASAVLTDFYLGGSGHAVNHRMAAQYARRAAQAGVPGYAYTYGMLNLPGYEATIDFDEGLRWLRTACQAGDAKGCAAASALDLQRRVLNGGAAKGLFVASWGGSLIGAYTDGAFPELPCVTSIGISQNGSFPSFQVDWTRTTTRRTAQNTVVFEGAIQVGDEVRDRLVITNRNDGGEGIIKIDALQRLGRLNSTCQTFVNGY
jgi:TPR repeat protein